MDGAPTAAGLAVFAVRRAVSGRPGAPGRHLVAPQSRSDDVQGEWFNFRGVVPASHAFGQHRV